MFSTFWGVAAWKYICSQLFRERLSEKVHATILKGIVGVSDFSLERISREGLMFASAKGKQQK